LLPFSGDVKAFTLPEVVSFQGATDDEDVIFLLSDAEIYPIVHHLAKGLKLSLGDIKLDYLRTWDVRGPVEAFRLIATDDQNVLFVYHDNLTLAYLAIVHFEGGPPQRLKVVKGMLVQLCEVE
jgi:hypothetical protein